MVYWIVWTIVSLLFFAIYSAKVLPALFRIAAGFAYRVMDRGLGEFNLTDGISVLYEPDFITSKYIKRYQIYRKAGDRYAPVFLGEWGQLPRSIEYEISAYDRRHLLLEKKRICKNPTDERFTETLWLPFETAFIALHVRRVDGVKIADPRKTNKFFLLWLVIFALLAAFALVGFICVILSFLSRILGGFDAEGLLLTPALWCGALLLPALLFVAGLMSVGCLFVYRENIAAWTAPFICKIRTFLKMLGEKTAAVKRRVALWVRCLAGKIRCALHNVCSLVGQSNVFLMFRRFALRFTRPFRVRKRRRMSNG